MQCHNIYIHQFSKYPPTAQHSEFVNSFANILQDFVNGAFRIAICRSVPKQYSGLAAKHRFDFIPVGRVVEFNGETRIIILPPRLKFGSS